MVGASAMTLCSASAGEIRPRAKAMPAAGTAATTSGRFFGRAMANASTAKQQRDPDHGRQQRRHHDAARKVTVPHAT